MSPSRVSGHHNVCKIERMARRHGAQVIECGTHVEERAGPSAAGTADPPVFNRPHGKPGVAECRREWRDMRDVVFSAPTAAVNQHHHRVGPRP